MTAPERGRDARAIGELLPTAAGVSRTPGVKRVWTGNALRTFQPVRRKSYHLGDKEHTVWRRIADGSRREGRRFAGTLLSAARRYDRETREPGKENGKLGHLGVEVFEALLGMVDYATGRLEPSIQTLMDRTRRSRSAVCEGLRRLKDAGFVHWIRRTVPVENPEPFGPQVKQTSNAYGFDLNALPEKVRGWVKGILGKGPVPDDAAWRAEQADVEQQAMVHAMPLREQGSTWLPDHPLGRALDRLAAALESSEDPRSGEAANASSRDGLNPGTSGYT